MPPKFDPSRVVTCTSASPAARLGRRAPRAPKIGPLGLSPKIGEDIAKETTKDWKGLDIEDVYVFRVIGEAYTSIIAKLCPYMGYVLRFEVGLYPWRFLVQLPSHPMFRTSTHITRRAIIANFDQLA
ncbi:hypothetical protein Syun_000745 [Stephania yunnanensis]|uniref:Uncharacterized protein n=1 Tax=Stephania yunnanensis TaxID=152371 RepID=A0AAP0LDJ8_9MAGN